MVVKSVLSILSGPDFEVMVISVQRIIFLEYAIAIKNLINFFFLVLYRNKTTTA